MKTRTSVIHLVPAMACALLLGAPADALAHCDGLDGPVVTAARNALDARNPALVLIWVSANDEAEVRAAFDQTLAVRGLNAQAKALADRYFFETVVRVHRTSEGAPYTGLKPAGRDLGPAIAAADAAIDAGAIDPLVELLTGATGEHLRQQFAEVRAAKAFAPADVVAGRAYVESYVEFIHYVERLYEAIAVPAHGHFTEAEPTPEPH